MRNRVHKAVLMSAMLLAWLTPAVAQVTVGENTNLNLSGNLSFGYSGDFSETDRSSHGLDFGGLAQLNGYYYNPRFLSFDLQPYYRRSQNNSVFQTITNGSGFNGSTNFFTGSHFPGSVSYSKTYDTTGEFGIPGISGVTTHGNSQGFGITWSALLPDLPTLTASYSSSDGTSSVFGANTDSKSHTRNFTLQSTHTLEGFQLQGQYTHLSMDATFPAFFAGGETQNSSTGSNSFIVTAGHTLPLAGYWSLGWNRSSFDGSYSSQSTSGSNTGAVNNVNTNVSLNPVRKLGLGFGVNYNDNVYGSLQQQLVEAGSPIVLPGLTSSAHSLLFNAQAGYSVFTFMSLYGRVTHSQQWFAGRTRDLTQFSGNAAFNFAHRLLGALTFSVGVVDTATDDGNSGATLVGNVNFMRQVHGWELGGNFGYTQQVETLVDVYTTSMYRYGSMVKRRFGKLHWMTSFNGSHSGLQRFEGFSSRSEAVSMGLYYDRYGVHGQYSQSYGTSILTPGGLIGLPPGAPPPVLDPILYNAKSYGGGGSFRPFRRAVLSATYSKATSDTAGPLLDSAFNSTILNARLQYRLRKLDFDANFTRFQQSISTGTLPANFNTYYIRVSRWFNVF